MITGTVSRSVPKSRKKASHKETKLPKKAQNLSALDPISNAEAIPCDNTVYPQSQSPHEDCAKSKQGSEAHLSVIGVSNCAHVIPEGDVQSQEVLDGEQATTLGIPGYDESWKEHYSLPPRIRTRTQSQEILLDKWQAEAEDWLAASNLMPRASSMPCIVDGDPVKSSSCVQKIKCQPEGSGNEKERLPEHHTKQEEIRAEVIEANDKIVTSDIASSEPRTSWADMLDDEDEAGNGGCEEIGIAVMAAQRNTRELSNGDAVIIAEEASSPEQFVDLNEQLGKDLSNERSKEVLPVLERATNQTSHRSYIRNELLRQAVGLRINTDFQQVLPHYETSPFLNASSTEPFPNFVDSLFNSPEPSSFDGRGGRSENSTENAVTGLGIFTGADGESHPLLPHERADAFFDTPEPPASTSTSELGEDTVYLDSPDGLEASLRILSVINRSSSDGNEVNPRPSSSSGAELVDSSDCTISPSDDLERANVQRLHRISNPSAPQSLKSGFPRNKSKKETPWSEIHLRGEANFGNVEKGGRTDSREGPHQGPAAEKENSVAAGAQAKLVQAELTNEHSLIPTRKANGHRAKRAAMPFATDHDPSRWVPERTVVPMAPPSYKKDWLERLGRESDLKDVTFPEAQNFDLKVTTFADCVRVKPTKRNLIPVAWRGSEETGKVKNQKSKPWWFEMPNSFTKPESGDFVQSEESGVSTDEGFTTVKNHRKIPFRPKVQRSARDSGGLRVSGPTSGTRSTRIDFSKVNFSELAEKGSAVDKKTSTRKPLHLLKAPEIKVSQPPIAGEEISESLSFLSQLKSRATTFVPRPSAPMGSPQTEPVIPTPPLRQHLDPTLRVIDWSGFASTNSSVQSFKTAPESPLPSRDPSPSPSSTYSRSASEAVEMAGSEFSASDSPLDEVYSYCCEHISLSLSMASLRVVGEEDGSSNETNNDGSILTPNESITSFSSELTIKVLQNEDPIEIMGHGVIQAPEVREQAIKCIGHEAINVSDKEGHSIESTDREAIKAPVKENYATESTDGNEMVTKFPKEVGALEFSTEFVIELMSALPLAEFEEMCNKYSPTDAKTLSALRQLHLSKERAAASSKYNQVGENTGSAAIRNSARVDEDTYVNKGNESREEDLTYKAKYAIKLAEETRSNKDKQKPDDVRHQKPNIERQPLHIATKSTDSTREPKGRKLGPLGEGTQRFRRSQFFQNVTDAQNRLNLSIQETDKTGANPGYNPPQAQNIAPPQLFLQHDLENSAMPVMNSPLWVPGYPTAVPAPTHTTSATILAQTSGALETSFTQHRPTFEAQGQQPVMWLDFYGETHTRKPAYPKLYFVDNLWVPIPTSQRVLPPGWTDEEVSLRAEQRSHLSRSTHRSTGSSGKKVTENFDQSPGRTPVQMQGPSRRVQDTLPARSAKPVTWASGGASSQSLQRMVRPGEPSIPTEEIVDVTPCGNYTVVSAMENFLVKCPDCDPDAHYEKN